MVKKELFGGMSPLLFGLSKGSKLSTFGAKKVTTITEDDGENQDYNTMDSVIQFICIVIAVYLALPCKKNGRIDPLQIILAICLAPCYIVYRLLYPCGV